MDIINIYHNQKNLIIMNIENILLQYESGDISVYNRENVQYLLNIFYSIFLNNNYIDGDGKLKFWIERIIRIIVWIDNDDTYVLLDRIFDLYLNCGNVLENNENSINLTNCMNLFLIEMDALELQDYIELIYNHTFINYNGINIDINIFIKLIKHIKFLFINFSNKIIFEANYIRKLLEYIYLVIENFVSIDNYYKNNNEFKIISIFLDLIKYLPFESYLYKLINYEYRTIDNNSMGDYIIKFLNEFYFWDIEYFVDINNSKNSCRKYWKLLNKFNNFIRYITPINRYIHFPESPILNLLKNIYYQKQINIIIILKNEQLFNNEFLYKLFKDLTHISQIFLINNFSYEYFFDKLIEIHKTIFFDPEYENIFLNDINNYLDVISYNYCDKNNYKLNANIKLIVKYYYISYFSFIYTVYNYKNKFLNQIKNIINENISANNIYDLTSNFIYLSNLCCEIPILKKNILGINFDVYFDFIINNFSYNIVIITILNYYFKLKNCFNIGIIKKYMNIFFQYLALNQQNNLNSLVFKVLNDIISYENTNTLEINILNNFIFNNNFNLNERIFKFANKMIKFYFYTNNNELIINLNKYKEMKLLCIFITNNISIDNIFKTLKLIKNLSSETNLLDFFNENLDKKIFINNLLIIIKLYSNIFTPQIINKYLLNLINYFTVTDCVDYNNLVLINYWQNNNLINEIFIENLIFRFKVQYGPILEEKLTLKIYKCLVLFLIIYIKYIKNNLHIGVIKQEFYNYFKVILNNNNNHYPKVIKDILIVIDKIIFNRNLNSIVTMIDNYKDLDIFTKILFVEIYYKLIDNLSYNNYTIPTIIDILLDINNNIKLYWNYNRNHNDNIENQIKYTSNIAIIQDSNLINKIFNDFKIKTNVVRSNRNINVFLNNNQIDFFNILMSHKFDINSK